MSPSQIQRGSGEGSREEEMEEGEDHDGGAGEEVVRPMTGSSDKTLSSRPTSVK